MKLSEVKIGMMLNFEGSLQFVVEKDPFEATFEDKIIHTYALYAKDTLYTDIFIFN